MRRKFIYNDISNEEWQRFTPGVRMYKGKKTYFYNGVNLWNEDSQDFLIYNWDERQSWEVIIILPGVEIIPDGSFIGCINVEFVIMSDSVQRIEICGFLWCERLKLVKLSRNLEYIGKGAFMNCYSLASIFIPQTCREICDKAFSEIFKLIIFTVPQHTILHGHEVVSGTSLIYSFGLCLVQDGDGKRYTKQNGENVAIEEVNQWIKDVSNNNEFDLHRECASCNPSEERIFELLKERGIASFTEENKIGMTASRYLEENPFSEIDEQKLINRFVLDLMGEIIT